MLQGNIHRSKRLVRVVLVFASILVSSVAGVSSAYAADTVAWTSRTPATGGKVLNSVAFGASLFVAVGNNNTVMTSPDGINWTAQTGAGSATTNWSSVAFGTNGTTSAFVAVAGSGPTPLVMTSPDGITWTSRTSSDDTQQWSAVAYGGGKFVAVSGTGANGTKTMGSSNFGASWMAGGDAPVGALWNAIAYGGADAPSSKFVAVANMGSGTHLMYSASGGSWTAVAGISLPLRSIAYGGGAFVAVSSSASGNDVLRSTDGMSWSASASGANTGWNAVTYGNGMFVAVSGGGTGNRVMTSTNGLSWTVTTTAPNETWWGVTAGSSRFVAAGGASATPKLMSGVVVTPPTITTISPSTGSTSGGTSITISGADFAAGATVTIGGNACTSVVVTPTTSITCTTPAGTAGAKDVVVLNSDGGSSVSSGGFTYSSPVSSPTISTVSPSSGSTSGGTSITITGTDFAAGASVTVGGIACTSVVVVSTTQITCVTPAGVAGSQNVIVSNTDTGSALKTGGFTYSSISSPTITSVSPTSGTTAGGTSLTINGSGFVSGATVTVGGTACTSVVVVSATQITCTAPAGTAGAQDVVVTNPDTGAATSSGGFTYVTPAPPVPPMIPQGSPTISGSTEVGGMLVCTAPAYSKTVEEYTIWFEINGVRYGQTAGTSTTISWKVPTELAGSKAACLVQAYGQHAVGSTMSEAVLLTAPKPVVPVVPVTPEPPKTVTETKSFDIFYGMNSTTLNTAAKNALKAAYTEVASKLSSTSTVTVDVTGWVQPTKSSPNVSKLSNGRAQAVVTYLKSLGLKATYVINAPGHDKSNSPSSRRASVVITWADTK